MGGFKSAKFWPEKYGFDTSKGFFMEEMAQISQIWLCHKIGKKYSGLILMMDSLYELVACGDMFAVLFLITQIWRDTFAS